MDARMSSADLVHLSALLHKSRESSVIAVVDEQTEHTDLPDPELARV